MSGSSRVPHQGLTALLRGANQPSLYSRRLHAHCFRARAGNRAVADVARCDTAGEPDMDEGQTNKPHLDTCRGHHSVGVGVTDSGGVLCSGRVGHRTPAARSSAQASERTGFGDRLHIGLKQRLNPLALDRITTA